MKILLLNQAFYPDFVSTAQHLTDVAVELAEQGHEVTVISSQRAYDDPKKRFAGYEEWKGIKIHRIGSTGFGKSAKWKRALDFASFLLLCCFKLFTLPRHDAVLALTSPPLISVLGVLYSKLRKARFYYWIMDLNPDEAIAAGWLEPNSLPAKALETLSRFSMRNSENVIALDRFMADRVAAKGIARGKILTLPPWSHDEHIQGDTAGRERFREKHNLTGKFVVMYSGNHSPCHPLDTVLEAAKKIQEHGKNTSGQTPGSPGMQTNGVDWASISFLFVGGGSEFAKVKKFAAEHQLSNILCLPYQPLAELSGSLSAADLHMVVMGNAFVGIIHPCKVYNILRIGRPVLYVGPATSHITDLFREAPERASRMCYSAPHGSVDAVLENILAAAGARAQDKAAGTGTFAALAEPFSKSQLLPQLITTLESSTTLSPNKANLTSMDRSGSGEYTKIPSDIPSIHATTQSVAAHASSPATS